MSKKFLFLMSFVLVVGLIGTAHAQVVNFDKDKYNLSFELKADGNQATGHYGMPIFAWTDFGSGFQGLDAYCAGCTTGTHCHCIPATEGCMFMYLKNTGGGVYQIGDDVNDPNAVIAAGLRYTMTFDSRPEELSGEWAIGALYYDDGSKDCYDDPTKLLASGTFFCPRTPVPLNECDCGPQGGLAVYDDACWTWTTDLTVSYTVAPGHPAIGYPLGLKLVAMINPSEKGNHYGFFDNVRVTGEWATQAYNPNPADEAVDVARDANLSWAPGLWADKHIVYFSDDVNKVSTRHQDANQGIQDVNIFDPTPGGGQLVLGKTYYWTITEVKHKVT